MRSSSGVRLGDRYQHRLGQLVALEQMAELEDDRLVRDGVTAESRAANARIGWMS